MPLPSLIPALPEIVLAVMAMAVLMIGVFARENTVPAVSWASIATLFGIAVIIISAGTMDAEAFGGMFIRDSFGAYLKIIVLAGAGLTIWLSIPWLQRENIERFEYPVLILFAVLGMMIMLSANNLLMLYLGLELQNLALYVLAAFKRSTLRSSEAGMKYFLLGALSSGLLLYGISLVYGFSGELGFGAIADALQADGGAPTGVIVGLAFVAAGLAFKISAVPFHMWTPDVYEGAPTITTAFFAAVPKIAAIGLFVRLMLDPFAPLIDDWRQIIVVIAVGSMVLGAFAAMRQTNIKRLMAYSGIGNVGYALVGLAAGGESGAQAVLIYMTIYVATSMGAFALILAMRREGRAVEQIDDLAGLSKSHPMAALGLTMLMFSMAGIPPLAGFFGKLAVFLAAIEAGLIVLAVIGVLTSVVAAFYYLRIIKLMYFDETEQPLDGALPQANSLVLSGSAVFALAFLPFASLLLVVAERAAQALFS